MKTMIWMMVLVLAGTVSAWAYQPEGWLFSQWPYAYSMNEAAWYYFNEPSTQWRVSLPGGVWEYMSQGGTATGWNYYQWPYCYSLAAGGWFWFYADASSPQWCVNLNNSQWSTFGQADVSPVNVAGTWRVYSLDESQAGTLTLSQSGTNVTGTAVRDDGLNGPLFAASVSGNSFNFAFDYGLGYGTFSATVSGNTMSGSYVITEGGSTVASGDFTATR